MRYFCVCEDKITKSVDMRYTEIAVFPLFTGMCSLPSRACDRYLIRTASNASQADSCSIVLFGM